MMKAAKTFFIETRYGVNTLEVIYWLAGDC